MNDKNLAGVGALVSEAIAQLRPYEAGKPAEEVERELGVKNALKLASNENAYGPPLAALEAAKLALSHLELYPDAASYKLRQALAQRHEMPMNQVVVGNGSNELIGMIARVFVGPGEHALSSAGSFIAYRIAARSHGRDFVEAPLGTDFGFDVEAVIAHTNEATRVVYVANPNNPTGSYLRKDALSRLAEGLAEKAGPKGPPILVLDEAYLEYVDEDEVGLDARLSSISIFETYPRTVILRTFSKAYGLAALRVGYALCRPDLADFLNRVRDPFNLNTVGQSAALAALGEVAWVEATTRAVIAERKRVANALRGMDLLPLPSQCNFLLVDVGRDAKELNDQLMRRGVIARPMGPAGLPRHLRVTIGRPEDNDRMLSALGGALAL